MKNLSILVLIIALSLSIVACTQEKDTSTNEAVAADEVKEETTAEETEITPEEISLNVAGLKGPTSMGMIQLIDGYKANEYATFNYQIASDPKKLVGQLVQGKLDIAAVPTNLASIIYNKTKGNYKLVNINTLNVIYVLTNGEEINSIDDLKGKTIHVSGKGATPDFVTRYILEKNDLKVGTDVELDFSMEHATLAKALTAGEVSIAVLPQPFVTTVTMRNEKVEIALDMLEEWQKVSDESVLAMGGLIVKKDVIENHQELLNEFLVAYEASVTYVNNNPKEASELIAKHGILPKAKIAELAIPKSSIVYKDAVEIKDAMDNYYKILFEFDPKSIGGKLPDEEMYYER